MKEEKEFIEYIINSLKERSEMWKKCKTEFGQGCEYAYKRAANHIEELKKIHFHEESNNETK